MLVALLWWSEWNRLCEGEVWSWRKGPPLCICNSKLERGCFCTTFNGDRVINCKWLSGVLGKAHPWKAVLYSERRWRSKCKISSSSVAISSSSSAEDCFTTQMPNFNYQTSKCNTETTAERLLFWELLKPSDGCINTNLWCWSVIWSRRVDDTTTQCLLRVTT